MSDQKYFEPDWNVKLAALNCLTMLILGAMGGHKKEWSQMNKDRFMKGQVYQMIPSLALLMNGLFEFRHSTAITISALLGNLFFVLPLYGLAWTDGEFFMRHFMPYGGVSLMVSFGLMLF